MSPKTLVSLRVDIDTIKDAEAVPEVVALLGEYGVKATFFVTTGPDNTFKNWRHNLNPMKLMRDHAFSRYGVGQMFRGLMTKRNVEDALDASVIIDAGHELGLHGYCHYEWMNSLSSYGAETVHAMLETGCSRFETAFGFMPASFAAPGFSVSDAFLRVLDEFGFVYSSDFTGEQVFYPKRGDWGASTLQVPVSMLSIKELEDAGWGQGEIFDSMAQMIAQERDFFVFYIHPTFELRFRRDMLKHMLGHIQHLQDEGEVKVVTMLGIARSIVMQSDVQGGGL